jgi:hypothetical protein
VTAFFVPELSAPDITQEEEYAALVAATEAFTGMRPRKRRIHKLHCRRGHVDCEAEVGRVDPIEGGIVVAILDLGTRQPFVIHCRAPQNGGSGSQILVRSVYSVTEFTA